MYDRTGSTGRIGSGQSVCLDVCANLADRRSFWMVPETEVIGRHAHKLAAPNAHEPLVRRRNFLHPVYFFTLSEPKTCSLFSLNSEKREKSNSSANAASIK